jgi:hypothetical protein
MKAKRSFHDPVEADRNIRTRGVKWAINSEQSRTFLFHIARFLAGIDNMRRSRNDGDIDRACVLLTIWLRTLEVAVHDKALERNSADLGKPLEFSEIPVINATTIAKTTGLARETVRRKVKELAKGGIVVDHGRGRYALAAGSMVTTELFETSQEFLNECLNFINNSVQTKAVHPESK